MRLPARPLTLRGRLLAALLVLCTVGLTLFAAASLLLLQRSLLSRVDQQLLQLPVRRIIATDEPNLPRLPSEYRVIILGPTGTVDREIGQQPDQPGGPTLDLATLRQRAGTPFTVPDRDSGSAWRVRAVELPDQRIAAVALSLASVYATVRTLLVIEAIVGGIVLALIAVVALVVVALGLRPLTRIERTAEAIAGGELDRRVPEDDPRTETGRLGAALNVMLGRLAAALRERERSERRLRQFVADASHELRTPLTSIRGFAELYRRGGGSTPAEVEMLTGRIEAEATRMGVLVDDLLLLARLDQQRALEVTEVDLFVLAADAVHDAKAREPDRPVTLVLGGRALLVQGDENKLRQVVTNLVTNALLHTPAGTPVRLAVRPHVPSADDGAPVAHAGARVLPEGALGVLEVHDDGPGISPDHASRVFDRFYSSDPHSSTARGGSGRGGSGRGGSGLGLAITAAILEAHRGRIELRTAPGSGTTFRVLLPLASSPTN